MNDVITPKYSFTSEGKYALQSKEDIKKVLGRSPDWGDSFMLAVMPLDVINDQTTDVFTNSRSVSADELEKQMRLDSNIQSSGSLSKRQQAITGEVR